ncbi:ubiquitin carboxyl-terminal hydrolase Usp2-like isoform X1 [Chrysoperla carnea]|uniref:ubiquitin carboxyl-terminal hydrolase Usp2-like isoform X1 n=1 Tax=Chrysoperla carnea TaxID=189513 RepID=UPI001D093114|nr:ubiquitin carboxyl-terminal hydrolase Usp2-like isoform X1 [Chrysoperla carnea]XP_044740738.1 ubiquitin carboxyl-terminal hydrolase Usp2-like isoform X1 [Chrysoperla carnea]
MSVEVCLSNSGYNNTKNLITMPVVSQRRSSTSSTTTTSPLTGSYRSTSSSDRSYYGGTSTATSTFSRNSSYLRNLDSKRVYSRHTSISEDSGIGSRTSSYTRSDRETSIRRGDSQPHDISGLTLTGRRISSISIANSVDDIRQKYSPSNYVPNIRKPESNKLEITRSKSITNDIGKPPTVVERKISPSIERKTSPTSVERRVNKVITNMPINSLSVSTNTEKVIEENAEENDDVTKEDNNGNVQQQSVSEIRKIFDTPAVVGKLTSVIPPFLKNGTNSGKYDIATKSNELNQNLKLSNSKNNHLQNNGNNVRWTFLSTALPNLDNMCDVSELNKDLEQPNTSTNNHTTNFASYIPVNVYETQPVGDCSVSEQTDNIGTEIDTVEQQQGNSVPLDQTSPDDTDTTSTNFDMSRDTQHDFKGRTTARLPATDAHYLGDLSTSPRLNRSTIASTNGSSTISALNRSSPLERHREEKTTNSYNSKSDKNIGLNGLKNIGNTCFMNSVIQCLSNTRLLLEYLRDNTYLNDINTTNSSMKGALVKAFANVIQELWGDDSDKIVNPSSLKYQIQHFAPRFMGYAQQDAQEFLRYLLEGLHEDVNRVKAKPPPILTEIDDKLSDSQKSMEAWNRYLRIDDSNIVDIFVGQLKSTLKCSVCGYCSVTFDPFWDLSLPIGSGSITQCLENFTREEVMDGHEKPTCSKCQTRRKCTKSFSIQKFPKILVLHLKRFSPNERFRGKLTTLIDFPLQNLDLSAFAANRGTSSVYNLYAVSNHSGTTYSGHYTAYCKHPYSGEWHEYNDSRVSTISSRHVVSSEAYVLFYELSGHSSHL